MTAKREKSLASVFEKLDEQMNRVLPGQSSYIGPYGTPVVTNDFYRRDSRLLICVEGQVVIKHHNRCGELVNLVMKVGDIAFVDMNSWFAVDGSSEFCLLGFSLNNTRVEISMTRPESLPLHKFFIALPTNDTEFPYLFKFFRMCREFVQIGEASYLTYFSGLIVLQLRQVIESFINNPPGKLSKSNFQFQNLMAYMGEYSHLQISRKSLADTLDINADYINELFRRFMHNSFKETISRLRLERAREMVKRSTMKIRDIATLCGFNSQQNFIYSFGNYFTVTPLKMRKALTNDKTSFGDLVKTHLVQGFDVRYIKFGEDSLTKNIPGAYDENVKHNMLFVSLSKAPVTLYFIDGEDKYHFAVLEYDERLRLYGASQRVEWKLFDERGNELSNFSVDRDNLLIIISE